MHIVSYLFFLFLVLFCLFVCFKREGLEFTSPFSGPPVLRALKPLSLGEETVRKTEAYLLLRVDVDGLETEQLCVAKPGDSASSSEPCACTRCYWERRSGRHMNETDT